MSKDRKTPVAPEFSHPAVKLVLFKMEQAQSARRAREFVAIPQIDQSNPKETQEASRKAWAGQIEACGFASYTCKAEGGSSVPARPLDWTRERLAVLKDLLFPSQSAFSKFLGNVRRWVGQDPSPEQVREALEAHHAGKCWRNVLPRGERAPAQVVRTIEGLPVEGNPGRRKKGERITSKA